MGVGETKSENGIWGRRLCDGEWEIIWVKHAKEEIRVLEIDFKNWISPLEAFWLDISARHIKSELY